MRELWRGGFDLLSSLPFPAYRGKAQFQAILWAFVMQNRWKEDETEWPKAKQMDFWLKIRAQCPLGKAYPLLGGSGKKWWAIWWKKSGLTEWCGSINNSSGEGKWEASRSLVHYEIGRVNCNKYVVYVLVPSLKMLKYAHKHGRRPVWNILLWT